MSNLKLTKKQTDLAKDFVLRFSCAREIDIKTPLEHKLAMLFIKDGSAKIVGKKNYGKVARIKNSTYESL